MKVKVYPENGETQQDIEDKLEKAVKAKRKRIDRSYARESYHNTHLDEFHDHVQALHKELIDSIGVEIEELLVHELGVANARK